MADTIAEFISPGDVSKEVKHAADRLLDVLKTCVQATKHAADEVCNILQIYRIILNEADILSSSFEQMM